MYNRRKFIKMSGTIGAGLVFAPIASGFAGCSAVSKGSVNDNFGIQLYTLRDVLPNDVKGVLKQLAAFGYRQIESYVAPQGIYWGMKNTEFKKLIDDLGMKLVASHCDINDNFEKTAAEAAGIKMDYLVCPSIGPLPKLDDYKRFADRFNQCGEICRKNGIKFGYHNHDYSFKPLGGQIPQDVLMQNTGKGLVDYEMDIYWVVTAGQDPIAWLQKYPGRFRLSHIKDRKKGVPLSNKEASTNVGTGSINLQDILKVAKENGMQYYFIEQEVYENTTPLDAAKAGADYMKKVRI